MSLFGAVADHYVATAVTGYPAAVLADSPLFYARLGEASGTTLLDSSGNARNGTYTGVTLGAAGAISDGDTAATLAGASSSVGSVAYGSWMDLATTGTIECWVKYTGTPASQISFGRTGAASSPYWIGVTGATALNGTHAASGSSNVIGTKTINNGAWHHLVTTWTSSVLTLYVDGVSDGTISSPRLPIVTTETLQLGGRGANYFAGSVDEIALYATNLSSTRVAAHYAAR